MKGRGLAITVLAFGLAILAGGLTLNHAMTPKDQAAPAITIGGPFTLIDGDGKTVTERNFPGKWKLIYFGYTHCPDACPTALSDMAVALRKLGPKADRIVPIFITVDPDRDKPAIMRDYVASFGPQFVGLTGSAAQIAQAEREYHVYAAKHETKNGDYDMDHSSIIYVMDPNGRFVGDFTHESDPAKMAERLDRLIR